jgi:AAA15 family ATPase/GTPase
MKLRQLKISNILSFPYVADLPTMESINFDDKAMNTMHILIGANGSGKSNFIEIINQFVRNLILDYTFDKTLLQEQKKSDYQNAIQLSPKKTSRLTKNSKTQDKPAGIEITLELFENDFENIGFVCKYTDTINHIIAKYSKLAYRFPHYRIEDIVQQCKIIHICADFSEKDQSFTIQQDKLSPLELFTLICIQEQELLYICIRIFNEFERYTLEQTERKS